MTDIDNYHATHTWLSTASTAVDGRDTSEMWERDGVLQRAVERVVTAVNDRKVARPVTEFDERVELLSYPAARIIVSIIDDSKVLKRYARGEAKLARNLVATPTGLSMVDALADFGVTLEQKPSATPFGRSYTADWMESAERDDIVSVMTKHSFLDEDEARVFAAEVAESSATDAFDLLIDHPASTFSAEKLAIPVADFARLAANVDDLKLAHQDVEDGLVFLCDEEDASLLLEEAVYQRVAENLPLDAPEEVTSRFEDAAALAEMRIDDDAFEIDIDRVDEGIFPPVMKELISDIQNGAHLTHDERFAVAAFLVNIGMSDDDIVDLFELASDFAEDETRYQLNHIRNGGGDGEPYTPPSYSTIETWGIDWEMDALEQNVKHPLQYYRIKLAEDKKIDGGVSGDA